MIETDKKYVWYPFTQDQTAENPLHIVKSKGIYLIDEKVDKYLYCNSSCWVNNHVHNYPPLIKDIKNQLEELPDFICLSKRLTSGIFSLGVTVTSNRIYNAFLSSETKRFFLHDHSFNPNTKHKTNPKIQSIRSIGTF